MIPFKFKFNPFTGNFDQVIDGDAVYLRLDTTNDPLTGDLIAENISPNGLGFTLGTALSANRWSDLIMDYPIGGAIGLVQFISGALTTVGNLRAFTFLGIPIFGLEHRTPLNNGLLQMLSNNATFALKYNGSSFFNVIESGGSNHTHFDIQETGRVIFSTKNEDFRINGDATDVTLQINTTNDFITIGQGGIFGVGEGGLDSEVPFTMVIDDTLDITTEGDFTIDTQVTGTGITKIIHGMTVERYDPLRYAVAMGR